MSANNHGGKRKNAGRKALYAHGELKQYRVTLDKPTVRTAKKLGEGILSMGIRLAVLRQEGS